MGKGGTFKKVASKINKAAKTTAKVANTAAYAAKYNKEIGSAIKYLAKQGGGAPGDSTASTLMAAAKGAAKGVGKGAKFLAAHSDEIGKAGAEVLKDPRVQQYILEKSVGYGLKKGEKALDKKLGKYKGYRIARGGVNLLYNVGTGNVGGALNEATNIYAEADPNKKRVAKVRGYTSNLSNIAGSLMSGDVGGAAQGAMNVYAMSDPNKKRVAKVQKKAGKVVNTLGGISQIAQGDVLGGGLNVYSQWDPNKARVAKIQNYTKGAADLLQAGALLAGSGQSAYDIQNRSAMEDVQAQIKNKKVNNALSTGANINQHKNNIIAAHDSQNYQALADHAKMLHKDAKKANKMQQQPQIIGVNKPVQKPTY